MPLGEQNQHAGQPKLPHTRCVDRVSHGLRVLRRVADGRSVGRAALPRSARTARPKSAPGTSRRRRSPAYLRQRGRSWLEPPLGRRALRAVRSPGASRRIGTRRRALRAAASSVP